MPLGNKQACGHMVSPEPAVLWSMPEQAYAGIFQDPEGRVKMSLSECETTLPFLLFMGGADMKEGK